MIKKFLAGEYRVVSTIVPNDISGIDIKGKDFETAIVDLMDEKATQQFVEFVAAKHESIEVAILTVGGFALGNITETKTEDIVKQYKLNFETA